MAERNNNQNVRDGNPLLAEKSLIFKGRVLWETENQS